MSLIPEHQIPEHCVDGAAGLSQAAAASMALEVHADWAVAGTSSMQRSLEVQDFKAALALVQAIGAAAEEENHHPDLLISRYRRVTVTLTTHDAGGLSANDFVMARRCDALVPE